MAHGHNLIDTDTHFIIDANTRFISIGSGKTKVIQGDHLSEKVTFELKRYIDSHDMTLCNKVQVHFINIGTKGDVSAGVYDVKDLMVGPDSEDVICFSWQIDKKATHYAGVLNFAIKFECIADDGTVEYAWGTEAYKNFTVGEFVNIGEAIEEAYPDILQEWEARLDALEQGSGMGGADWNAADGEPGYVENRTHYTEGGYSVNLQDTTLTDLVIGTKRNYYYVDHPIGLKPGQTYKVRRNEDVYEYVAQDVSTEDTVRYQLATDENDEYMFFRLIEYPNKNSEGYYVEIFWAIGADDPADSVISVYQDSPEIVHKLDAKYLPEGVPYVYKGYLLEETDAVETTDPNYGKIWVIQNPPTVTAGETYTVIYNGVMYDCVGLDNSSFAEGAVALGNASVTGGANTGEPFAMAIVPNYAVICMDLSGATSVRIGIMGKVGHKIDPLCMPDTLYVSLDASTMTADKNCDEIWEAMQKNHNVFLRSTSAGRKAYAQCVFCAPGDAAVFLFYGFGKTNDEITSVAMQTVIYIKADGSAGMGYLSMSS